MFKLKTSPNRYNLINRLTPWLYRFFHRHRFWFYGLFLSIALISFPVLSHGIANAVTAVSPLAIASGNPASTPNPINSGGNPVTIAFSGFVFFVFLVAAVGGLFPSVAPFADDFVLSPEGRSHCPEKTEFATAKRWLRFTILCGAFCFSTLVLFALKAAFPSETIYLAIILLHLIPSTILGSLDLLRSTTSVQQRLRKNLNNLGSTILNTFLFFLSEGFFLITLIVVNIVPLVIFGRLGIDMLFVIYSSYFLFNALQGMFSKSFNQLAPRCSTCQQKMFKVSYKNVKKQLNFSQRTAQAIKSTRFEGWHCSHCHHYDFSRLHLRSFPDQKYFKYPEKCPQCQTFTLTKKASRIVTESTRDQEGLKLTKYRCVACHFEHEKQEIIPRITVSVASGVSVSSGGGGGGCGGC